MNPVKKHEGILVLGPPRSGTTLLRRLLDAHPHISCPSETYVFTAAGRFLRESPIAHGVRVGPVTGLALAGMPAVETVARLRELCFGLHRSLAEQRGKRRWASKTPWDVCYLDEIEALCGDHAHFVGIVRHGLDTVCSIQDLCLENEALMPELHAYTRQHAFALDAYAHFWTDVTTRLVRFTREHAANAILVRYEDLVADPAAVLATILASVGEAPDPTLVERAMSDKQSVGLGDPGTYRATRIDPARARRRERLSDDTRRRLGVIMNPALAALGYDVVPAPKVERYEDVLRQYQVGLLVQALK